MRLTKLTVVSITAVLILSACTKTCMNDEIKNASCNSYKTEASCKAAIEPDGTHCIYDRAAGLCTAKESCPKKFRNQLGMEECRASTHCRFNEQTSACSEANPSLNGTCDAIKSDKDTCIKTVGCSWDDASTACRQQK